MYLTDYASLTICLNVDKDIWDLFFMYLKSVYCQTAHDFNRCHLVLKNQLHEVYETFCNISVVL